MHEPWIERVIREAQEAGHFDDLEGSGRPIPSLGDGYDPAWWVRRWTAREQDRKQIARFSSEVERALVHILAGSVKGKVQADLESLHTRIVEYNATLMEGNGLQPIDVDRLMSQWEVRHKK